MYQQNMRPISTLLLARLVSTVSRDGFLEMFYFINNTTNKEIMTIK